MSETTDEATSRKAEIINACAKLYETKSFKEINIKNIGEATTFSRTSIYNYFETKEEIFLELFKREFRLWNEDLENILGCDKLSKTELADKIAKSVSERKNLLKLLSMNIRDIEENSSIESLTKYKVLFGRALSNMRAIISKFTDFDETAKDHFIYTFFPFMYGIYPYANVTEKQKAAMNGAKVDFKYMTIYQITYNATLSMLGRPTRRKK